MFSTSLTKIPAMLFVDMKSRWRSAFGHETTFRWLKTVLKSVQLQPVSAFVCKCPYKQPCQQSLSGVHCDIFSRATTHSKCHLCGLRGLHDCRTCFATIVLEQSFWEMFYNDLLRLFLAWQARGVLLRCKTYTSMRCSRIENGMCFSLEH